MTNSRAGAASQNEIKVLIRPWPIGNRTRQILGPIALIAVLFVTGCGVITSNSVSSEVPVIVTTNPAYARLGTGGTMNFAASVKNGTAGIGVTWSVNGVRGGNPKVGTITPSTQAGARATYRAPANISGGQSVAIVATYAGEGGASSDAAVDLVPNKDSTLSGQFAFQVSRFEPSGLSVEMVGTFTSDGHGGLSNVFIDTNAVQFVGVGGTSFFTSKVSWNGSYSMDTVSHGSINLALGGDPATQMNFSFVINNGSGALVEMEFPLGPTASGTFSAASSSGFTLAPGGLSGTYVMKISGPTGDGGYDAKLGQFTFAQTSSSTTAGTVTGSLTDAHGSNRNTSTPGNVTMDADGSGHGTISLDLDSGGTSGFSFYVSDSSRIFILQSDQVTGPETGVLRSQTIPSGGFNTANILASAMVFDAIGVNADTRLASVLVGAFSPDPGNPTAQVLGEYDARDGVSVLGSDPVALAGSFTVDPIVPGKGTLAFTQSGVPVITFVFYMRSQGQGFILEQTVSGVPEARVGQIVTQTAPFGGFVNATLNGITNTIGTETSTSPSVNGVAVIQFGTGTYTETWDASALGSGLIGNVVSGPFNFTDALRGRATFDSDSVLYLIDQSGAGIIICIDPATHDPQIIKVGN